MTVRSTAGARPGERSAERSAEHRALGTPVVAVLGGGSFGRGLALAASRAGTETILWSRSSRDSGSSLVRATQSLEDVAQAELIFVAVPSDHVQPLAREVGRYLDGSHLVVHVSRGLVGDDLRTLTQVVRHETPCRRVGAIAGPLVAKALLEGLPGALIVGTRFPEIGGAVRKALAGPTMRTYVTEDVIGVEVASAMVGLLCLATGYAQAFGMGPGTLAAMVTRGMSEAARIGKTLGGEERTFYGLAGFGDLIAAIAGDDRPEIRLGRALARGASLEDAGREAGAHIEGVTIARRVAAHAERLGIEAPVAAALHAVLSGKVTPEDALSLLMSRRSSVE